MLWHQKRCVRWFFNACSSGKVIWVVLDLFRGNLVSRRHRKILFLNRDSPPENGPTNLSRFYTNTMGKRATTSGNENIVQARVNVNKRLLAFFKRTRREVSKSKVTLEQARAACAAGRINSKNLQFLEQIYEEKCLSDGHYAVTK